MKYVMKLMFSGVISAAACVATIAYAEDCKSLQDDKNLIYAAKGYCFKDKEVQKEFGSECYTNRPSFGDAEKKRLAEIEEKQKQLKCPKKD